MISIDRLIELFCGTNFFMEQESDNNLFEVKLDETGKKYIHKMYRLVVLALIGITIISLTSGILEVHRIIEYADSNVSSLWSYLILRVHPVINLVIIIVNVVAITYYYKFGKGISSSIDDDNPIRFNDSFRLLYRNVVVSLVALALNIASYVIVVVVEFKY